MEKANSATCQHVICHTKAPASKPGKIRAANCSSSCMPGMPGMPNTGRCCMGGRATGGPAAAAMPLRPPQRESRGRGTWRRADANSSHVARSGKAFGLGSSSGSSLPLRAPRAGGAGVGRATESATVPELAPAPSRRLSLTVLCSLSVPERPSSKPAAPPGRRCPSTVVRMTGRARVAQPSVCRSLPRHSPDPIGQSSANLCASVPTETRRPPPAEATAEACGHRSPNGALGFDSIAAPRPRPGGPSQG
mmetsp:Transcript_92639/g.276271  ORF Transcript_92639/g.276271 Transcript_92639/m.276271 type:complete len:249 (+) Transcript_92639:821-1567(+)